MNVFLTITDSYSAYAAVTIRSYIDANPDIDFTFYILSLDLSEDNKLKLRQLVIGEGDVEVCFLEPIAEMNREMDEVGKVLRPGINSAFVMRLLAEEILPATVDKILFSDVDILVKGSLAEIDAYEFPDGVAAAAAKDLVRESDYSRLDINSDLHRYFNAGVMLINLNYWREHRIGRQALEMLKRTPELYYFQNQDVLNKLLAGKVEYLHPRYNCLVAYFARSKHVRNRIDPSDWISVREATRQPAIIHFVFLDKPWHKGVNLPYRQEWTSVLQRTPYAALRLYYRGGIKGCIKLGVKRGLALLPFDCCTRFRSKFSRHNRFTRLFAISLYYGFLQWLPGSFSGSVGRMSNRLRRLCVRYIFAEVGENVNIGRRVHFGSGRNLYIGDRSNLGDYCTVPSDLVMGDDVMMGPGCYFFNSFTHSVSRTDIPMIEQGIKVIPSSIEIGDDVWFGMEVMVMPGKKIGSHSIVGARSLVTKDVPQWSVVGGNPAKVIKYRKNC